MAYNQSFCSDEESKGDREEGEKDDEEEEEEMISATVFAADLQAEERCILRSAHPHLSCTLAYEQPSSYQEAHHHSSLIRVMY